jgi:hypothetical protein
MMAVCCIAAASCQEGADDDAGGDDTGGPQNADCEDSEPNGPFYREVVLSAGAAPGVGPVMAVDSQGTPTICFVQSSETGGSVACSMLAGGAWQRETVDSPASPPYMLAAAFDQAGALHLAYSAIPAGGDGVSYVLVHASNDGGGWETEAIDDLAEDGLYPYPSIAAVGDEPYLIYSRYTDYYTSVLQVARRTADSWAAEVVATLSSLNSSLIEAGVAVGADGEIAMIYGLHPVGGLQVTRGRPGSWRTEVIEADFNGARPAVQFDSDGRLQAVVWRYNSGIGAVYAREGADGWTIEKIGTGSKGILGGFGLDECGVPHAAFFSWGDTDSFNVDFTVYEVKTSDEWASQQVDDFGVSALVVRSGKDVRMAGHCCVQPNPEPLYDPVNGGICYVTSD